ncbi:hypothetical protein, partial [Azospirillum argentinense]
LLGKIETDGDNAHVDGPPVCGDTTPTTLWHSDAEGQRSSTPSSPDELSPTGIVRDHPYDYGAQGANRSVKNLSLFFNMLLDFRSNTDILIRVIPQ